VPKTSPLRDKATLAFVCIAKRLHAPSVRPHADAFAEDPALADDLVARHRYCAACAAAACGEPQWRPRALEWLRADLAARTALDPALVETLQNWRRNRDLAGVRDAIDDLPEDEREGWRKLWADVDAALAPKYRYFRTRKSAASARSNARPTTPCMIRKNAADGCGPSPSSLNSLRAKAMSHAASTRTAVSFMWK